MSRGERLQVMETAVETLEGRIPVIAGAGANDTAQAVQLCREAADTGVDALLVVTPYYNKATQRGLAEHYEAVADSVDRPVIAYDVPSRTGVTVAPETYAILSKHPNIIGTKEASGNFAQIQKTRELCGDDFFIWSGNDEDTAAVCMLGGKGVISVAANVIPWEMHALTKACLENDYEAAGKMQLGLRQLMEALFWEVNPIPVKTALHLMGYCEEHFRLPMCPMEEGSKLRLKQVLSDYGLL